MSNGSRQHSICCYSEEVLEIIKNNYQHACYIKHDQDVDKDGVLKQPHWHVLIYTENQKTSSAVVRSIQSNCKRLDKDFFDTHKDTTILSEYIHAQTTDMLEYMTHANSPHKYPYKESDIGGDWTWWKDHSKELSEELLIEREDWTVAIFGLLNDKLRMNDGSWVLCREDVFEIAKNHGRDFFLNFRRAIDSMRLILNAEIVVLSKNDIYRKFEAPKEFEKMVQEEENNTK